MRLFTIALLAMAIAIAARADGIPVDHKTDIVTVPHTIVRLNSEQIEELQALGTLTFTSSQWKQLRKKAPGIPKRYDNVLPVNYEGCTCGMNDYCIALSRDRIAILTREESAEEQREYVPYVAYEEQIILLADEHGSLFYVGHAVTMNSLCEALKSKPDSSVAGKNRSVIIQTAPMAAPQASAFQPVASKIRDCAEVNGWKCYADILEPSAETGSGKSK